MVFLYLQTTQIMDSPSPVLLFLCFVKLSHYEKDIADNIQCILKARQEWEDHCTACGTSTKNGHKPGSSRCVRNRIERILYGLKDPSGHRLSKDNFFEKCKLVPRPTTPFGDAEFVYYVNPKKPPDRKHCWAILVMAARPYELEQYCGHPVVRSMKGPAGNPICPGCWAYFNKYK